MLGSATPDVALSTFLQGTYSTSITLIRATTPCTVLNVPQVLTECLFKCSEKNASVSNSSVTFDLFTGPIHRSSTDRSRINLQS